MLLKFGRKAYSHYFLKHFRKQSQAVLIDGKAFVVIEWRSQAFARFARAFASILGVLGLVTGCRSLLGGGWRISDTVKHWQGVYMQFAMHALCKSFHS
jgi:hypothetical protein